MKIRSVSHLRLVSSREEEPNEPVQRNTSKSLLDDDRNSLGSNASFGSTATEILGQLLNLDHSRVRNFSGRDLLNRALRNLRLAGDDLPLAFAALKLIEHVLQHRLCHMTDKTIPMYGYSQPGHGHRYALAYVGMVKKPKNHKPVSAAALRTRERLAENVQLLMERDFPESKYSTASAREKALAKAAGCSWSTIQRILAPIKNPESKTRGIGKAEPGDGVGTKIDTLADLAGVFEVSTVDLLTPNFARRLVGRPTLVQTPSRPGGMS